MTENELDNLWDEYSKTDMVQRFGQYVYNKTGLELMSTYNESSGRAYSILMKHVRSKPTIQIKNYADFCRSENVKLQYSSAFCRNEIVSMNNYYDFCRNEIVSVKKPLALLQRYNVTLQFYFVLLQNRKVTSKN